MRAAGSLSMLKDALVVAAVAVLTVQGLRRWYGDRYLVPSDSMQPVLYGDPVDGDVVFVDKTASIGSVGRGDLVVVENPSQAGHQLVKRIAASGDDTACWIDIRNGDVWLGEDEQHMQPEVKEPRRAMQRSVTWARAGGGPGERDGIDLRAATGDGPWTLPPAAPSIAGIRPAFRRRAHRARHREPGDGVAPAGAVGTAIPVDATFVDAEHQRSTGGSDVSVLDCGIELRFGEAPETLLMSIDSSASLVTFVYVVGENRLLRWVDGRSAGDSPALPAAAWQGRVTFGRLDGRDFVLLDDDFEWIVDAPQSPGLPRPQTWVHFCVTGKSAARFDSMRVFRDVYSWRQPVIGSSQGWPRQVVPGHWFLLGDNAFDSRDSRQIGSVPMQSFLGVPSCVIGPWSRRRMLPR